MDNRKVLIYVLGALILGLVLGSLSIATATPAKTAITVQSGTMASDSAACAGACGGAMNNCGAAQSVGACGTAPYGANGTQCAGGNCEAAANCGNGTRPCGACDAATASR